MAATARALVFVTLLAPPAASAFGAFGPCSLSHGVYLRPHVYTPTCIPAALFPWSSSSDDATADTLDDAAPPASRVTQLLSCVWRGSFERGGRSATAPPAKELSGLLDGEESVRSRTCAL